MRSVHPAFITPIAAVFLIPVVMTVGCRPDGIDNHDKESAYESYRSAMHDGDWESVFVMLLPEVKNKLAATFELNRKTMYLIEKNVPAQLRANYLDEIGPASIRDAVSPAAYFAATVQQARRASDTIGSVVATKPLSFRERPKGSRKWTVLTLGGERINIQAGTDGLYYIRPDNADADRINQELNYASGRLAIQQRIAADLSGAHRETPE